MAVQSLPDEAQLPPSIQMPTSAGQLSDRLPSESTLPEPEIPQPAEDPVLDTLAGPLDEPAAGETPWLRLDMRGHTATVRALAFTLDSMRLCSAGEDKNVEVWGRPLKGDDWFHQRTVRWQVQRGPRGRIYALAPGQNLLALAGQGAMGGNGEILLVDPATGRLERALLDAQQGHRQVIAGLAFSPDPRAPALASVDVEGRAVLWQPNAATGLWRAKQLVDRDTVTYGIEVAELLRRRRRMVPVAVSRQHVFVPVYGGELRQPAGAALWYLERISMATGARERIDSMPHYEIVTALAVTPDGHRLVSADLLGNVYIWDLARGARARRIAQPAVTVSAALSADGRRLVTGTALSSREPFRGRAAVQLWETSRLDTVSKLFESLLAEHVYACALSPDLRYLTYAQGNAVEVLPLDEQARARPQVRQVLRAPVTPVVRVAFAKQAPLYRIAIGRHRAADGDVPLEQTFDLAGVQLGRAEEPAADDWLSSDRFRGAWSLREDRQGSRVAYWLYEGEQRRAKIPLRPEQHGSPTATCWLADVRQQPFAVAVGTDGQNNIYVFRLAAGGDAPLLRQFRGHGSSVLTLSASADGRYLVSGSSDATIGVWQLADFDRLDNVLNRWGAEFAEEDGALVVQSIREDGPLYFRGLRQGDTVRSLAWNEGTQLRETQQAAEMLAALDRVPFDTLVLFRWRRGPLDQPDFQLFPAWQQLATLLVADNREWAYWTPAGYYDASFDGHRLFGWQVNRGVRATPDFYLAAQFRRTLERPDVMRRLLGAGSLERAFEMGQLLPPPKGHDAIVDQYRLAPDVTILAPRDGAEVPQRRTTVRASVRVPRGQQLAPPQAFANGVAAVNSRLVEDRADGRDRELIYEWEAALPSDEQVMLQVIAATESEAVDFASVMVRQTEIPPTVSRRLYIFAVAVNQYRDAQIQRLDFAVNNATRFVDTLTDGAAPLYVSEAVALLDDHATQDMWRVVTQTYVDQLRDEVSPDDLVLVFLSGHGVRDRRTEQYYYVTSNARFVDLMADRYGDCLSFQDLVVFRGLPCRKLAVLDTCHSGAIQQPLLQQDLKAALRALQEDVVFTLTASEGQQEAVEQRDRSLGRFTSRLLEALKGAADESGNRDGQVTLNEAIAYVKSHVREDSRVDQFQQYPTAGPVDLLPLVNLPLTVATRAQ